MEKEVSIEKHYYLLNAGLDIYMKVNILTLIVIYHGGLYKINQTNTRHRKGSHEAEK